MTSNNKAKHESLRTKLLLQPYGSNEGLFTLQIDLQSERVKYYMADT